MFASLPWVDSLLSWGEPQLLAALPGVPVLLSEDANELPVFNLSGESWPSVGGGEGRQRTRHVPAELTSPRWKDNPRSFRDGLCREGHQAFDLLQLKFQFTEK